jgi:hypothetical protein
MFTQMFVINCKYYELLYVPRMQIAIEYDLHLVGFKEVVLPENSDNTESRTPTLENMLIQ